MNSGSSLAHWSNAMEYVLIRPSSISRMLWVKLNSTYLNYANEKVISLHLPRIIHLKSHISCNSCQAAHKIARIAWITPGRNNIPSAQRSILIHFGISQKVRPISFMIRITVNYMEQTSFYWLWNSNWNIGNSNIKIYRDIITWQHWRSESFRSEVLDLELPPDSNPIPCSIRRMCPHIDFQREFVCWNWAVVEFDPVD